MSQGGQLAGTDRVESELRSTTEAVHGDADPSRRGDRLRARVITYGAAVLLLAVGVTDTEAWPLTSLHLFSHVRTDTATTTQLYAVMADGTRVLAVLDPRDPVMRTTSHLYPRLADAPRSEQVAMIDAWLGSAGIDPSQVRAVRLEKATRVMDPGTLTWEETERELVVEVIL